MTSIWNLFASVKLAITTLCLLAFTSIFGTIIPQGNNFDWYIHYFSDIEFFGSQVGQNAGYKIALICNILDIPNMYSSWWFTSLLLLLSINLIVCSIDRFPSVIKQINADNLGYSVARLSKMKLKKEFTVNSGTVPEVASKLETSLSKLNWKPLSKNGSPFVITAQKGKYSRIGVYIVHLSILVIFAGAFVGSLLGYKGSVMIPETKQTDAVYQLKTSNPLELGFTVRCDSFYMEYYDNGTPKEYTSHLTILENDQIITQKEIEVNKPLTYKGITFYQASYEPYQDFVTTVTSTSSGRQVKQLTPFQSQQKWPDEGISYGIINAESMGNRLARVKVWFSNGKDEPTTFWTDPNTTTVVKMGDKEYSIYVKQMFATGLQVAKDPGVWLVYLGCGLMMVGLYMAFFMSHRRIWLTVEKTGNKQKVILYGTSNKNQLGFSSVFEKISAHLERSL